MLQQTTAKGCSVRSASICHCHDPYLKFTVQDIEIYFTPYHKEVFLIPCH